MLIGIVLELPSYTYIDLFAVTDVINPVRDGIIHGGIAQGRLDIQTLLRACRYVAEREGFLLSQLFLGDQHSLIAKIILHVGSDGQVDYLQHAQ